MIRSFIKNVSHNSRSAPLSTVNFARKPVASIGATLSSGTNVSLVASLTGFELQLQHLRDKFAPVERREVVDLFPRANEARRNAKFILNCNDDSTFAAAVEFCDDQASKAD